MKDCFGYVRVSTAKQGDGVSLSEQKSVIAEYAARKQLRIIKWWEEKQTAAKKGRPAFNEMVTELRCGKASGLVIHKIDRSARNYHDWATISDLADSGIGIFIATESFDFNTYGGRMAADFMAVVSANYVRNLREEIHKGQLGQVKRGLYSWGAPIGYQNNGKNRIKTPDPVVGPLKREAFELYASGEHSYDSLLREMQRRGLRNRSGNPISMCGLSTVLNNPFYYGKIRMPRWSKTYEGKHEPLVSVRLFQKVQRLKVDRRHKKVTRHQYLYRGLFHCGHCGSAMIAERQKGHVYYRCHEKGCLTKTVREERIEEELQRQLRHIAFSGTVMARAERRVALLVAEYGEAQSDKTITLRLAEKQQKLERLTDALIDGLIDKKTFATRRASLELEIAEAQEIAAKNLTFAQKAQEVWKFLELAESLATTYLLADPPEKRRLVKMATSNRRVAGKKIEIGPSDQMLWAERAIPLLSCADTPGTSRTLIEECEIELPANDNGTSPKHRRKKRGPDSRFAHATDSTDC